MELETLRAQRRTESGTRPARRLRRAGNVPAVVYGKDVGPVPVAVDAKDLYAVLHTEAGLNAIIDLEVEGDGSYTTVAREIQRDPVRGDVIHVDFIKVSLDVAIEAEVGVEYEGVPIGVREDAGILETLAPTVTVSALPGEIPSSIPLDISGLHIGETMKVADLPEIPGVEYLDDPDRPLITVIARAAEEEVAVEEIEGELEEGAEAPSEGEPEEDAEG